MHIIPFCVKTALLTTHTAVDISHNSKCCARMLYTRMFTRQFINDSCSTSRVSNTQHNSDIEHVTHLGYQTHWDQNVRRIVQMLNPYFARLNERHNVRIIHNAGFMRDVCAIQVLYGNTGPIRKAGFARDRNAGFIRDPYAMQVLHGISPIPQVFYGPLRCLPKHLSKFQLNASNYYPPA